MPFTIKNIGEKTGEIKIYGVVGDYKWYEEDVTPNDFQNKLDDLGDVELLNVYINSPGGNISAGVTIYNILKRHPALVATHVDGIAASIASVILQAGDERVAAKNSTIYIHNPIGGAYGYSADIRKYADYLDKFKEPIVSSFENLKISNVKLRQLMDEETLMTAQEALKMGFVDKIDGKTVKAKVENNRVTFENVTFDIGMFKNFDLLKINIGNNTEDEKDISDMEKRFHLSYEMQNAINVVELNEVVQ